MNKGLMALLALSLAANVFLGGFVAGRMVGGPPHERGMGRGAEFVREMSWRIRGDFEELSPAARNAFRKVFEDRRDELRGSFRETRRLRRAFSEALSADIWNRTEVEAALAALRAVESAHQATLAASLVDAFEGLSPEDRKALVAAMDRRRPDGRGRRGPRDGNGPPRPDLERRSPPPPSQIDPDTDPAPRDDPDSD